MIGQDDLKQAAEVLSKATEVAPLPLHTGLLSGVCFRRGKAAEGEKLLARLHALSAERYITPLAFVFASIGRSDSDGALTHLQRAIEERTVLAQYLNVDPYYEPLKTDPRFFALVTRLNLPLLQSSRR